MASEFLQRIAGLFLRVVTVITLASVLLAECGRLTPWTLALVVAGHLLLELHFTGRRALVPGLLVTVFLFAVTLILPNRGEWLPGGWDPGVNMNQGLLVARTGAVNQPPDSVIAELLRLAPGAFTRSPAGFLEVFPGIPVNRDTGALDPYFYRGTPAWIAALALVGGEPLALRSSLVIALLGIVLIGGLLRAQRFSPPAVVAGCIAFAAQPMFLHHASTPASEMLELLIVLGIGFAWISRRHAGWIATLVLLGCINRVSFLLLASILLSITTLWHAADGDRRHVSLRHLSSATGLLLGLAWYAWVAPDGTAKITHLMPLTLRMCGASLVLWLVVDGVALLRSRPLPPWTRWSALALPLLPVAIEFTRHAPWQEFLTNGPIWLAYTGWLPAIVAIAGIALALRIRSETSPWILWLVAGLISTLLHRHAADLYPWATKRWLVSTTLLVGAGASVLVESARTRFGIRGLAVALLTIALAVVSIAPKSLSAWRGTEYDGARAQLDNLRRFLEPGDIVLADHFLWATPLALAKGFTVLNGEPLLNAPGRGRAAADALAAAARSTQRRVVLLTTTREGLEVLPTEFRSAREIIRWEPFHLQELIQHRENRDYSRRPHEFAFRIWIWDAS